MLRARAKLFHALILSSDVVLSAGVFLFVAAQPQMRVAAAGEAQLVRLLLLGLVASLAWPVALEQLDLYSSQRRRRIRSILGRILLAGAVSTALLATAVLGVGAAVAPIFPVVCGFAQLAALGALRLAIFSVLHAVRRRGRNYRRVLVVGSGSRARQVREEIDHHPEWGLRIVGFVDDADAPVDPALADETIHKFSDFPTLLAETVINEVIVACPRSMLAAITPVVAVCASTGVPVTLLADLFGDLLPPPRVTRFDVEAALSFAPVHHSRTKLAVKRTIDVAGALVLMLASAPVVAVAALLVRVTSPGPVFFRQLRCGLNGRTFAMWKLRTMCADAEERKIELLALNEMDGPVFKYSRDPRVTPIGRLLRRWSIDELPQLWNVLRGDMSLVGPRPPIPSEVAQYETGQRRRLSMRPGITCIWQVNGRNNIDFAHWVKLDVQYIDTWSLTNDLKILLKTIPAVIRGNGAS